MILVIAFVLVDWFSMVDTLLFIDCLLVVLLWFLLHAMIFVCLFGWLCVSFIGGLFMVLVIVLLFVGMCVISVSVLVLTDGLGCLLRLLLTIYVVCLLGVGCWFWFVT